MIELKETYDPPYNLWYGVKHKNLLRFKITYGGSLPDASALPPKALMPGVMFHMENDGSNYMWNGVAWDKMDSNPFVGATSSADGIQGLVPQPKKANREGFLYGGGGWKDLDASDVKTGVFNIARIPAAALERLVTVSDQTARFALTTDNVQVGDTVKQADTGVMYRVVDDSNLDNASGYVEYTAAKASYAEETNGIATWNATTDYGVNKIVLGSDGLLYLSIVQSGPSTSNAQNPVTDSSHTYWVSPKVADMPVTDNSSAIASTNFVNDRLNYLSPTTFYLDAVNGLDTNDGRTANTALKSFAGLKSLVTNYFKKASFNITVYVAAGTYDEVFSSLYSHSNITYDFASGVTIKGIYTTQNGVLIRVKGGPVSLTGRIYVSGQSVIDFAGGASVEFLNLSNVDAAIECSQCAVVRIPNDDAINNVTFTFTDCSFRVATIWCHSNGLVYVRSNKLTFVGAPSSGKSFRVNRGGGIIGMGSDTFIPGAIAGDADSTTYGFWS